MPESDGPLGKAAPIGAVPVRSTPLKGASITGGLLGITLANILGNVFSYGLLLLGARSLDAAGYSELITLTNLLLVGSIPTLALQAVTARRVAAGGPDGTVVFALLLSSGLAIVGAALSPLLASFLHLPGVGGILLVCATLPGLAVQGVCQGFWQGSQRFRALANTTFIGIALRSGSGLFVLALGGSTTGIVGAIAVGTTVAAVACLLSAPALRADLTDQIAGDTKASLHKLAPLMTECAHASHAYGVFLLLCVTDVFLARHVLPTEAAATYAAGSVITRGTLWLPQSVANVLFASLTDGSRHRRLFLRAAAGIAIVGVVVVVGSWLLQGLVTIIVNGDKYPALRDSTWLFAGLGSCLALIQFALVAGLAVERRLVAIVIWVAIACEAIAVLGFAPRTVNGIIGTVFVINLVAAAIAILLGSLPKHISASAPQHPNLDQIPR
ncbi:lipopolysaccharide biosynthesis protein [Jatrophihabitans sp. DSM 45814]